ncbi:hypothetical protein O6H91_17G075400 [Diphasiastrum complanatum]|uniref:Uncharacterized protein n=4 Tax=Diphasiastrum complanatum TaxID=34168 RepID=A0ACC2B896_DIPCM|nr:hypothetical protein O6H91_17G075400 [Diphasiastrum complanatum]KAJ7525952.1 hypothetical protein O6H91_17G075400 [Diphasiastrum complanatum]KAJ7525953.1 hypothetical protein O6H91_17G075400 [Diphasiastrum complanatum]KAJ7525954.1 hypothetical protein O6H91_17G075400 [Diphasiastrum complanatum]
MDSASAAQQHVSSGPPDNTTLDVTPLLENEAATANNEEVRSRWRMGGIQGAARYLRQAGSRRMMREPSMLVRETAAEHLEERQSDWAYSRPVVILDLIWNLAFVVVTVVVLILSRQERPSTPLRIWLLGYAGQCTLHMVCVCSEYRTRRGRHANGVRAVSNSLESTSLENEIEREENSHEDASNVEHASLAKRLESANTIFSFVWWIVGCYWVTAGGQGLVHHSPWLYWLCIIFLAFDVFFVIFCVALACVIGLAVCCCLPCIIAILYAISDQEGASEEDINLLPKYKFRRTGSIKEALGDKPQLQGGIMTLSGSSDPMDERVLSAEDAECCICLSTYDDGAELHELPCNHHFHCVCIDKWLRMNATCPLCKYNIIHRSNRTEDV